MITTCTKCGKAYEAQSEEAANEPGRLCLECWKVSAPEPEGVAAMCAPMRATKGNGETSDMDTVLGIYGDFRWGIKKASMIGQVTYRDIESLLEAAIKRVEKGVKDPMIREKVLARFTQAKNRLADWVDDEELRNDVCNKCQLPRFICGCAKSDSFPSEPPA